MLSNIQCMHFIYDLSILSNLMAKLPFLLFVTTSSSPASTNMVIQKRQNKSLDTIHFIYCVSAMNLVDQWRKLKKSVG